jgi:hypothetical protein
MQTETKPRELQPSPLPPVILLAWCMIVAGFVLTVLGIYEIGGLFNLGIGFFLIVAGSMPVLLRAGKDQRSSIPGAPPASWTAPS